MSASTRAQAEGRRIPSRLPNHVVLVLLAVFSAGPLVVLLFNSLKTTAEIGANPVGFPTALRYENFTEAWRIGNYGTTLVNSSIVVAGTVVGIWIISGAAAYALARLRPKGGDGVVIFLIIGAAIPPALFLVPLFFLWNRVGLTDSRLGLIIIYWGMYSPFITFLLRSFMINIPPDFEEAARVDGANEWQILVRVMLPIVWPGFLTAGVIAGVFAWNEFLFAVTFVQDPQLRTVVTSYSAFMSQYSTNWGLTNAGAVIMMVPVIGLFLLLQRRFIDGLTQGGLKG